MSAQDCYGNGQPNDQVCCLIPSSAFGAGSLPAGARRTGVPAAPTRRTIPGDPGADSKVPRGSFQGVRGGDSKGGGPPQRGRGVGEGLRDHAEAVGGVGRRVRTGARKASQEAPRASFPRPETIPRRCDCRLRVALGVEGGWHCRCTSANTVRDDERDVLNDTWIESQNPVDGLPTEGLRRRGRNGQYERAWERR